MTAEDRGQGAGDPKGRFVALALVGAAVVGLAWWGLAASPGAKVRQCQSNVNREQEFCLSRNAGDLGAIAGQCHSTWRTEFDECSMSEAEKAERQRLAREVADRRLERDVQLKREADERLAAAEADPNSELSRLRREAEAAERRLNAIVGDAG